MIFHQRTETTLPGVRSFWFPNKLGWLPVREGVYEVYWLRNVTDEYVIYYSCWDGKKWLATGYTFEYAETSHGISHNDILGWRGLANKP